MERDTFIFRKKWYEALKSLDDHTKAMAFECICEYALYHNTEQPQDPMVKMAMAFIIPELEADCDKWVEIKEKRSEAGRKGGAPKGNQNAVKQNQAKQANDSFAIQNQAKQADNVYVDVYDNVINKDTDVSMCSSGEQHDAISYKKLIEFWNSTFKNIPSVPQISSIEGQRKTMTKARIGAVGKDKFADAIRRAARSKFLTGGTFKFSYDWFVKPNNFPKVAEGNYDDANDQAADNCTMTKSKADKILDREVVQVGDNAYMFKEDAEARGVRYVPYETNEQAQRKISIMVDKQRKEAQQYRLEVQQLANNMRV